MRVCTDITKAVGNTPLVRINRLPGASAAAVYGKLESMNPLGSVKDRIAVAMIDTAEREGKLQPGGTIVEPTSGNTGIGLAFVAAARGYRLILCMPESMSLERRAVLKQLGAEVVLTPADKGMKGAIARAAELQAAHPDYFQPQQFDNPANPRVHYLTTGQEIWRDTDGQVDILVAGVGTGGSVTGAGLFLKEQKASVKVVAVEPRNSAVISGNPPGRHGIQGIGAGFVPSILRTDIIDEILQINEDDAFATSRALAKQEGILCGISAGGNVFAALQLAQRPENAGKTIVTIVCDTGERYLSTKLYE